MRVKPQRAVALPFAFSPGPCGTGRARSPGSGPGVSGRLCTLVRSQTVPAGSLSGVGAERVLRARR